MGTAAVRAHWWAASATPLSLVTAVWLVPSPKSKLMAWPPASMVESRLSTAVKANVWSVLALVGSTEALSTVFSATDTLRARRRCRLSAHGSVLQG